VTIEHPVLMYQSADKIQPRRAQGRYARLRLVAMLVLLGAYYLIPWIQIGGTPLVWFDLPQRQFHVFGLLFAPQDLIYLTWLLLIAALTLFFFTTLAGRLWCGYACPQTVWTEAFLWIEHLVEGDRHARLKLDRAPWTANKILRRGGRHVLWIAFALLTGLTFVAYFVPARELFAQLWSFELSGWPLFWSLFYGFATWGNAGFLREQVCKYMCPYARFQSAMFDRDTLIISYDAKRGEPRKSAARKRAPQTVSSDQFPVSSQKPDASLAITGNWKLETGNPQSPPGDCIDCTLCVQVCPTGIDIREGLQYECIACAACIDVCNGVMDAVDKPRGLIRYSSANQDAGRRFRLLRPRAVGYGAIWAVLCIGFVIALTQRTPLEFDLIRDRHSLYRQLGDGAVENVYVVKLANQHAQSHRFMLSATLADGTALTLVPDAVELQAQERRSLTLSVRHHGAADAPVMQAQFRIAAESDPAISKTRTATFMTGVQP
jgi:polyferredoxin